MLSPILQRKHKSDEGILHQRRCGGPSTLVRNEDFEDYIEQEEVEIDDEGYPGGPVDKSLLINYEDNVAKQLWDGLVSNEHYLSVLFMYVFIDDIS